MGVPELVALTIASTALSATTSAAAAKRENDSVSRASDLQVKSSKVQSQQVRNAAALQKEQRQREASQIRGQIRVAAGEAGVSVEGSSFGRLLHQADLDEQLNLQIIEDNEAANLDAVRAGADANLTSLSSQVRNTVLESIRGGVTGATAGLQIGLGVQGIQNAAATRTPTTP